MFVIYFWQVCIFRLDEISNKFVRIPSQLKFKLYYDLVSLTLMLLYNLPVLQGVSIYS